MSNTLPENWVVTTLGKVCEPPTYGWTTRADQGGTGLRFLRTTDLSRGTIDWSSVPFCAEEPSRPERYAVRRGDILISRAGSVGLSALIEDCPSAVFASYLIRFRATEVVDPRYLRWYLQSDAYWSQIADVSAGIALQNVNAKKLSAIELPLAPIAEQRRIVATVEEHLSDLDAAVAGLERARGNVSRYAAAVLDAAVHGSLLEVPEPHPSFTDDGPFSLPCGWRWGVLGDFLSAIEAGASFRCEERPPREDETGVVKVSSVTWGTYDEDESKTVLDDARIEDRLLVAPGDFLFSRANTIQLVGACVIAEKVTRRVMLSDKILRFRFRDLDPRWALVCLRSGWGRSEIELLATGNQESMRNIGQSRIRAIRIPVPPPEKQRLIATEAERRIEAGRRNAAEIDVQLARAARLRRSILKRAFEGKLVPQDPNDEPASILLARTKDTTDATSSAAPRARAAHLRSTARRERT